MRINKNNILNFIGVFLILISLIHLLTKFISGDGYEIFWLCNHVPLVMGLAILFRNQALLIGEFCLLSVGSLFWNVSFLLMFLFGKDIGSMSYLYEINNYFSSMSVLIHLSTLVFALIGIFLINKKAPRAWIYGAIHGVLLIPLAFIFKEFTNLNCILEPCQEFIGNFSLYPLVFIFGYIFLIIYPLSKLLNHFLKK